MRMGAACSRPLMTEPTSIAIRALGASDAEAFRALRLTALAQAPEAFGASLADESTRPLERFAERLAPPAPSLVFGAFSGTDLVGVAGFLVYEGEKHRHIGLLWGVYLQPEQRGQGTAARLIGTLIAHARQHVVILHADVGADNHPARRLYESLGFQLYGVHPKALFVNGRYIDEALLALDFTER